MEDPERETVMEILRSIGISEDIIFEFVVELFNFPALTTLPEYSGEDDLLEIFSEFSGHEGSKKSNFQSDQEIMGEDQKVNNIIILIFWSFVKMFRN